LTDIFVVGKRKGSSYLIDFEMGSFFFPIKLDTGAKHTVISVGSFDDGLTPAKLEYIKEYCEKHISCKERFISASGDPFWGYLTEVDSVRIGSSIFHDFKFYLVVENKRDIALLGFDFIDKCKSLHEPNGNYILSKFDEKSYKKEHQKALNTNKLISFMDSLSD